MVSMDRVEVTVATRPSTMELDMGGEPATEVPHSTQFRVDTDSSREPIKIMVAMATSSNMAGLHSNNGQVDMEDMDISQLQVVVGEVVEEVAIAGNTTEVLDSHTTIGTLLIKMKDSTSLPHLL